MPLGKRIKEARQRKNMTQEELARAVGVSKGSIGNYESGISSPNEPILIRLMEVLGVDANYVYQDYIRIETNSISEAERQLLVAYREANDQARADALALLRSHPLKTPATEQSVI